MDALDKMLRSNRRKKSFSKQNQMRGPILQLKENLPEVGSQVDNLPDTKTNQHAHGAESKPLNSLIGTFVGISELLLSCAHKVHLRNDFGDHGLQTAKVSLNWLELLLDLDSIPVTSISTDFNAQLNLTRRIGARIYNRREKKV